MRIVGFLLGFLLTSALYAPVASAQDFEAASQHFAAAQKAYGQKSFHAAATEFEKAYELTKDPVVLYNIGDSYQRAGEGHKAVDAFRGYLKAQPGAPDASDIKLRIAKIEKAEYKLSDETVAATASVVVDAPLPAATPVPAPVAPATDVPAPPPVPATVTPPPPVATETLPPPPAKQLNDAEAPQKPREPELTFLDDGPRTHLRTAAWVGVAATVAVFTTGAILGLAAQARADEISRRLNFVDTTGQPAQYDASAQSDLNNLRHDGQLYNGLAIGFFSASAALAVATVVLFVVDHHRAKERLHAFSGLHGMQLGLGGNF